jgi:hypothetical protein
MHPHLVLLTPQGYRKLSCLELKKQKSEGRSQAEGCSKSRALVLECLPASDFGDLSWSLLQIPEADADLARLMDVNVRFSARPWFGAALLGTGGG